MFDWDDVDMDELIAIRDDAALYLEKTNYIPAHLFNKTKKLLSDYREQATAKQPEPTPQPNSPL